ncbi:MULTISPECIES: hypothetical protein [unclassified Streptomyces]|uniref:hypothetical protein n=1 Tax=unclassified Streptomyces TaxID=2593676 RepID=UPI00070B24F0|nr:hypothetical protein [Streptomyces sp. Root1310]KQX67756.1 hypothetical protein ASD48_17075 [Streptomyces sp. Root1310]
MRYVSVRLRASSPHPRGPRGVPAADLSLRVRSAAGDHDVLARVGLLAPGGAPGADEHVAAEAGPCPGIRWPVCADVLHERFPRPYADAVRRLGDLTAAHPGCLLAAAPLTGGGWAVIDGTSRTVLPLAHRVPPDQPLLASCLHAWLVAGRALRDIQDIRVVHGG